MLKKDAVILRIVPYKVQQGEILKKHICVDYHALNSLLPPVENAHSKAQGVLSFYIFTDN